MNSGAHLYFMGCKKNYGKFTYPSRNLPKIKKKNNNKCALNTPKTGAVVREFEPRRHTQSTSFFDNLSVKTICIYIFFFFQLTISVGSYSRYMKRRWGLSAVGIIFSTDFFSGLPTLPPPRPPKFSQGILATTNRWKSCVLPHDKQFSPNRNTPDVSYDGGFRQARCAGRVNVHQPVVVTGFLLQVGSGRRRFVQQTVEGSAAVPVVRGRRYARPFQQFDVALQLVLDLVDV